MKKMKKIIAILIALVLCFALVACNKTESNADSENTAGPPASAGKRYLDSIEVLGEANIAAVDPYHPGGSGGVNRSLYSCIYDRLVFFSEGEYLPELATSWEVENAQIYTFHLREDVKFHNGDNFTAQDVVNTYEIAMAGVGSTGYEAWRPVATAEALDEYTVRLTLGEPNADFMYKVTTTGASIVSKAARDADAVKGPWVGTGAFYVTEYPSPDLVVIVRNDDYWGGVMPTRQISFRYLPETAARTIALQNGESQISFNISPQDLAWFESSPDFEVITFTSNVINTIGFNMNDPITGDINFRLAVAYATSNPEITVASSGDYAIPVTDGAVWGWGQEFKNTSLPAIPYDLDLARQYLAASPYNGEELELITGNPDNHRGGEMIQEQLLQIGVRVRLYQTDHVTLMGHTAYDNNQGQLVHYLNVFDSSSGSARAIFYPNGVWNMVSYNNAEVNDLLDRAPSVADQNERAALYMRVQEIVAEELPYVGIYFSKRCITCMAGVGGIGLDADLNHNFKTVYIEVDA